MSEKAEKTIYGTQRGKMRTSNHNFRNRLHMLDVRERSFEISIRQRRKRGKMAAFFATYSSGNHGNVILHHHIKVPWKLRFVDNMALGENRKRYRILILGK